MSFSFPKRDCKSLSVCVAWEGVCVCVSLCRKHNYNKILKSDRLSTALIEQYASCLRNWTVRAITRALKLLFFTVSKKILEFLECVLIKKAPYISQILLKLWLIGNRTSCRPIRSVIVLVINHIRGSPILSDRIGLHSVLLPLLIVHIALSISMNFSEGYYNLILIFNYFPRF